MLHHHSFPLSVALYRERILPNLGLPDPMTGRAPRYYVLFEGALEHAQFLHAVDMQNLEDLEANNPPAYVQQLLQLDYWL
ncbi:hypothetical protein [Brucella sp. 22210]|uniref:hypothetical protein n=1 Tax=Brucella sp. 22210 TaxID=3453892 RepID=UPI003F847CE6